MAAAWPFLGAPVGAGAATLTPMPLPMQLPVAQAQAVAPAAHSVPQQTVAPPAATPIVLAAPRHPTQHSAMPAAVTAAQTAAAATTRRRYIENYLKQAKQNSKIDINLAIL